MLFYSSACDKNYSLPYQLPPCFLALHGPFKLHFSLFPKDSTVLVWFLNYCG